MATTTPSSISTLSAGSATAPAQPCESAVLEKAAAVTWAPCLVTKIFLYEQCEDRTSNAKDTRLKTIEMPGACSAVPSMLDSDTEDWTVIEDTARTWCLAIHKGRRRDVE
ncbi:hypothetical protein EDC01DRAFT_626476 [Geopyxis carbonaria]|nr:hypothetical protein EDC01DRAFT_626476 [Geopyxis carbonaria]